MAVVPNGEIGKKLCKLFNLPKNTKWFNLRVGVNEAVTIECGYYPEDLSSIDLVTAKFALTEIVDDVVGSEIEIGVLT